MSRYTRSVKAAFALLGAVLTLAVSAAPQDHYTTTFPLAENPISEGGRWTNGGTVGLDWTNVSTTPGLAIGHQVGASYTDATALLEGPWDPDQWASAVVHGKPGVEVCYQEVELRLRSALLAHVATGYEISFKVSQSDEAYLIIVRWNGPIGDFTYLANLKGARYGVTSGDEVSASIAGDVITAYKNGEIVGRASDRTYAAGSPGMGFNLENAPAGCAGTNGNYGFSRFAAGNGRDVFRCRQTDAIDHRHRPFRTILLFESSFRGRGHTCWTSSKVCLSSRRCSRSLRPSGSATRSAVFRSRASLSISARCFLPAWHSGRLRPSRRRRPS